ncbi:MAG TPA: flagellar hook-basal body complex protein FliE [Polyangiaceae bacterium]|nr:flagellar hook-basal body complex protein FliE [Polyangiaceae bacterium]
MDGVARVGTAPIFASEASRPLEGGAAASTFGAAEGATPLGSFGSFITDAVDQANQLDLAASRKVDALASGAADDLHGTMISVKEAEISIKLVGSVRNKILDAFQELWRTSV